LSNSEQTALRFIKDRSQIEEFRRYQQEQSCRQPSAWLIYYLREEEASKQQRFKGRPAVCVAVDQIEKPLYAIEEESIAYWVHFCVATCSPQDLHPEEGSFRKPSKFGFGKTSGRAIAIARLKKRKVVALRTIYSPWFEPATRSSNTQVGLSIPVPERELNEGERTSATVWRLILGYLAEPTYGFAPTARRLAQSLLHPKPMPTEQELRQEALQAIGNLQLYLTPATYQEVLARLSLAPSDVISSKVPTD